MLLSHCTTCDAPAEPPNRCILEAGSQVAARTLWVPSPGAPGSLSQNGMRVCVSASGCPINVANDFIERNLEAFTGTRTMR